MDLPNPHRAKTSLTSEETAESQVTIARDKWRNICTKHALEGQSAEVPGETEMEILKSCLPIAFRAWHKIHCSSLAMNSTAKAEESGQQFLFFWQKPWTHPTHESCATRYYYNSLHGKSSSWSVQPWSWVAWEVWTHLTYCFHHGNAQQNWPFQFQ